MRKSPVGELFFLPSSDPKQQLKSLFFSSLASEEKKNLGFVDSNRPVRINPHSRHIRETFLINYTLWFKCVYYGIRFIIINEIHFVVRIILKYII